MKKILSVIVALMMVGQMTFGVFAAETINPRSSGVSASVLQGNYTVKAFAAKNVNNIEVEGTLYKKGWFGIWKQVDSCSGSSSTQSCVVTGSFDYETGEDYRLDYSVTFSYTDGQSETLTGSATN